MQLAAVPEDKYEEPFNQFVLPEKEISRSATNLHHIFERHGNLYRSRQRGDEEELDAREPKVVYNEFLQFLNNLKSERDDQVRLIGHNIECFDAHVLVLFLTL